MDVSYGRAADLQTLWDAAQGFDAPLRGGGRLPRLLVMTDPRAPEPELDWPGPVGVIYRHFGAPDRVVMAERLRAETRRRGHALLIGADPELAARVEADGAHFRRSADLADAAYWRAQRPDWLITAAAVKGGRQVGPVEVLDALLVSSVFASPSPSAGTPIGVEGLQRTAALPAPIFALGGVSAANVERLAGSGIAGVAGVSFGRRP